MEPHKIFISYSRKDSGTLAKLETQFAADFKHKYKLISDKNALNAGDEWRKQLMKNMDEAEAAIILLSDDAISKSPECNFEIGYLWAINKLIIPVLVAYIGNLDKYIISNLHIINSKSPLDKLQYDQNGIYELGKIVESIDEAIEAKIERQDTSKSIKAIESAISGNIINMEPQSSFDTTLHSHYKKNIENGDVTPFLGPLCCNTQKIYSDVKEVMNNKFNTLVNFLETNEIDYFESILNARMPQDTHFDLHEKTSEKPEQFQLFQKNIINLALQLNNLIGQKTSSLGLQSNDFYKYQVFVDLDDIKDDKSLSGNLYTILISLCEIALDLSSKLSCKKQSCNDSSEACFAADLIYQKLILLALRITKSELFSDKHRKPFLAMANKEGIDCSFFYIDYAKPLGLPVVYIEWLDSLLWHTIRYDMPIYPEHHDMFFYLTMSEKNVPPLKIRTGLAASTHIDNNYDCIQRAFRFTTRAIQVNRNKEKDIFHETIANCLCMRLPQHTTKANNKPLPLSSVKDVPIAISTNFDNELEKVFESRQVPYYILSPVLCSIRENKYLLYWLLTVREHLKDEVTKQFLLPCDIDYKDIHERVQIKGPIIVRMCGAPLEVISTGSVLEITSGTPVDFKEIKHRLILSDYDFFHTTLGNLRKPFWLTEALNQENRLLVFLGYPFNDMHGLLGFHLDSSFGYHDKKNTMQWLIDNPKEDIIHSDLHYLNADRLKLSPEQFIDRINEIAKITCLR